MTRSHNNYKASASSARRPGQLHFALAALAEVFPAVFGAGRPVDRVLGGFFRDHRQCGARDRRLISEMVFGVFRHWGVLRRALEAVRAEELERGGAFQADEAARLAAGALELEGVFPEEAAVLWREFSRRDFILTFRHDDPLERAGEWAARLGVAAPVADDWLPAWVSKELSASFPVEALVTALRYRPPMWLRSQAGDDAALLRDLRGAGLNAEEHPVLKRAFAVRNSPVNLFTLDAYRKGAFEVQDLASQAIGLVCAPKSGERWWDACAGAGGKTLQLADLLQRRGTVVASDIREYKLEDLRLRARRAGFPNIMTRAWDGKAPRRRQQGKFDGVLVDAPCSCSGVWRRNPDGRWKMRPGEIAEMAALQREILDAASGGVRPGGVLVYATCSIFEAENQGVVLDFLAGHPDFVLDSFPHPLTGENLSGMMAVLPGMGDCDSMFAARLRRRVSEEKA